MDWDTYSLEKPKYIPHPQHKCEITTLREKNNPHTLLREVATPSKPIEEYLRMGSAWRIPFSIMTYPHISSDKSISIELDEVKKQNESVLRVVSSLQKKVETLEAQLKKQEQIIEMNSTKDEEIDEFRSLFGLPQLSDKFEEISFHDLEGILNDLSQDGEDSVEVIRSIRG